MPRGSPAVAAAASSPPRPRYSYLARSLDEVYCAAGHRLPKHQLLQVGEYGEVRCGLREPPGHGPPCQCCLIVFVVNRREKCPETTLPLKAALVAEVLPAELMHMAREEFDLFQMFDFLGVNRPPPRRPTSNAAPPTRRRPA